MTTPLLTTKLFLPPLRQGMVSRSHLIERLNAGLVCKLTLISAPAGFGKTTLLSEWVSTLGLQDAENGRTGETRLDQVSLPKTHPRIAWLSLDERDNDPERFWIYFIAALQTAAPDLGGTALRLLESQPLAPSLSMTSSPRPTEKDASQGSRPGKPDESARIESALTSLINEIAAARDGGGDLPLILVLDDYHVITAEAIHKDVTFLLDHLPPAGGLHLVIAGRTDPPLPLSRLRGRRQLSELDETDLRFTPDEASTFLNQVMKLGLSTQDVDELEARTEGWVVGLQMAAQSIMGRSSETMDPVRAPASDRQFSTPAEFIRSFTGSHRDVVDYLTDEVLHQQPAGVQNFLLQTSILDRLCGPLCEAVCSLRAADSPVLGEGLDQTAQDTLEYLETANLFIVPMDSERKWFRYHHLFAELLHQRLNRRQPDLAPALHLRASEWYASEGLIDQAVSHALRAGDYEHAANLIQRHLDYAFGRGEFILVRGWMEALPEELVRSRPQLCVAYAYSTTNDLDRADRWIEEALTSLAALSKDAELSGADQDLYDMVTGHVAVYRAMTARARGETSEKLIGRIQTALEVVPESDHSLRSILALLLAIEQLNAGNEQAGECSTVEAIRLGEIAGSHYITLLATYALTIIYRRRARLREIEAMCRRSIASMAESIERSGHLLPMGGLIYIALGSVLVEWNDLPDAERALTKGLEATKLEPSLVEDIRLMGGLPLARLWIAQGEVERLPGLVDWITQSDRWSEEQIDTIRTHVWLLRSHREPQYLQTALRILGERRLEPVEAEWDWEIWDKLTWARAIIMQGRVASSGSSPPDLQPVLDFLDAQYRVLEKQGWIELMIDTSIEQALAFQVLGRDDDALKALERALTLAEPEGFTRIFLDGGLPMARLLYQAIQRGVMPEYVAKLLGAFEFTSMDEADDTLHRAVTRMQDLPSNLRHVPVVEPLTPREIEVLQLIAGGLSNRQIAQKLYITLSTVKRHNANIYGKLGVNSRTQAAARARDLGLL
jgi:LuxR family maltose regulon positive regulatory protein